MRLREIDDKKKVATKTKNGSKLRIDTPQNKGDVTPADQKQKQIRLKTASPQATRNRVRNIQAPQNAPEIEPVNPTADELAADERDFEPQDMQGYPELPRTTDNLPAVISKEVDIPGYEPEWTPVKQLPGYMQQGIRMMGRRVFKSFTNEKIENIQVMSTLINDPYDLNLMADWIRKNATRIDIARLDFENIHGYSANVQLWQALGYQFLMVEDFAGQYIYAWEDGKGLIQ